MQISNQSGVDREAILKRTVGRIQSTLQLSTTELKDYFGFSEKEYLSYHNQNTVSQSQLDRFASRLNLDPFKIMKGEIDYHTLFKQQKNEDFSLPERYTHHKKSRIKTASNIFAYLDRNHPGYSDLIANKLQISWGALSNPIEQINACLIDNIYSLMGSIGFSNNNLIRCGIESAKQYYLMPEFGSNLWSASTPKVLFDRLFNEQINYIDGTWQYRIMMLTNNCCQIKVITRESAQNIYKTKHFGCKEQCNHRMGFAIGLLQAAINKNVTNYHESKCIHRGDKYCQFDFFY